MEHPLGSNWRDVHERLPRGRLGRYRQVDQIPVGRGFRWLPGMLAGGFAVALALLIQIYFTGGERWLLGWMLGSGMAVVTGLGLWLAVNILRGGH